MPPPVVAYSNVGHRAGVCYALTNTPPRVSLRKPHGETDPAAEEEGSDDRAATTTRAVEDVFSLLYFVLDSVI